MNISKKIGFSFSLLIALMIGISCFSLYHLSSVNKAYTGMIGLELQGVYLTSEFQENVSQLNIQIRQYEETSSTEQLKLINNRINILNEQLQKLKSMATSEQIINQVNEVELNYNKVISFSNQLVESIDNKEMEKIHLLLNTESEYTKTNDQLNQMISNILNTVKNRFEVTANKTSTNVNQTISFLVVICIVSILITVFIVIFFNKHIVKPLRKIANAAEKIANGQLNIEDIHIHTKDEMAQLSKSFNKMKDSLAKVIVVCQENTLELSSISEQLNASASIVSETSTTVSTNIEQMTSKTQDATHHSHETLNAMQQASTAVKDVLETTQSIYEKSNKTSELALNGTKKLTLATEQMKSISKSASLTANLIKNLSNQSKDIQSMSQAITEITEQTSLLALNAAIEAARAGEHGKSFAVVADEVKKLAEQSKLSAKSIVLVTNNIINEISYVQKSMQDGLNNVEEGTLTINESNDMFNRIVEAFNDISHQLSNITVVTEQISISTNQVTESASQLNSDMNHLALGSESVLQQVEEQSATIQEIHAVSENITEKSNELAEIISHFQLDK